jgi:hypothetical protein
VALNCLNQSVSDIGQQHSIIVDSPVMLAGLLPSGYTLLSVSLSDKFSRDVVYEKERNDY